MQECFNFGPRHTDASPDSETLCNIKVRAPSTYRACEECRLPECDAVRLVDV
jgi:hypothetical protein